MTEYNPQYIHFIIKTNDINITLIFLLFRSMMKTKVLRHCVETIFDFTETYSTIKAQKYIHQGVRLANLHFCS